MKNISKNKKWFTLVETMPFYYCYSYKSFVYCSFKIIKLYKFWRKTRVSKYSKSSRKFQKKKLKNLKIKNKF